MKHFMIAARAGFDDSLKAVGLGYKRGDVSKDEYAQTLRAYKDSQDEMKSEQRTKAAAEHNGKYIILCDFHLGTKKDLFSTDYLPYTSNIFIFSLVME